MEFFCLLLFLEIFKCSLGMASLAGDVLRGAHIGGGKQEGNANVPSIFDYLAQDSLKLSMKPGLRAALKLFSQRFPRFGEIAEKRFDEIFLLWHAMLENHYLKSFSGSFSENFYGMKRVPFTAGASFASFKLRIRSLITLVLLPYITEKLEKLNETLQFQQETSSMNRHKRWRRLFVCLFPHLKAFALFTLLLFQVGYAFSWIPFASPLLLIAKCRLERLNSEDIACIEANSQIPLHMRKGSVFATIWRIFLWLPSAMGRLLSYGLFLLQFLEYCYTDELGKKFSEVVSGQRFRVAEYPFHTLPDEQQILCMEVDKCPLCKKIRQNDTVLPCSGYVFCHACIYNFVQIEARCPITSLPATTNELVKIYH